MRLNPYHPERFWSHLGRAQYTARGYAIASFSKLMAPDHTRHAFPRAASAQLGNRPAAGGPTRAGIHPADGTAAAPQPGSARPQGNRFDRS
jgi:adenylate cyclase